MSAPDYTPLLYWVKEREAIRLKRAAGAPAPWTDDEILRAWRFCNVRREDDKVTIWIRENIREPFADHPYLWFMLCVARQINWPDTLAELIAHRHGWPLDETFDPADMAGALNARQRRGDKLYTGAYMIPAPATKGADKQSHVAEKVLGALWGNRDKIGARLRDPERSLWSIHHAISSFKGWGDFLAYQAVVDMRFTSLLRDAPDVKTWAAAGPGTIRGLNRLYGRRLDKKIDQSQARVEMRAIYAVVQDETGVAMDFSDVPNILCEIDKYLRVKHGEGTPRAKYVAGRGA